MTNEPSKSGFGQNPEIKQAGVIAGRGALIAAATQASSAIISTLSIVLVARLVAPSEYGVIAMVTPITGFILIFQNLGLNQAVIQAKELTEEQLSTLFWVCVITSSFIALSFLAIAPVVAFFYDDVRAGYLTAALSITAFLSGFVIQHAALLNRRLRYGAIGVVDITRVVVVFAATLFAAYVLRSFWAIWIGMLVGTIINIVMVWFLEPWRPRRTLDFRGAQKMLNFGAHVTGFTVLNFLTRNVDNVLISRFYGASAVGLYDRSYKLMMFPLQNINAPLSRVMLPLLGRLQSEPDRYRRAYVTAIRAISLATIPGIVVAAVISDWLVPLLLGKQWNDAGPIFFWLSLAALTQPISNAAGWLFLSTGQGAALMKWGVFASGVVVPAFVIGLAWGPTGVACAYFIAQVVLSVCLYWYGRRGTHVRTRDFYNAIVPSLLGGGTAWLVSILASGSLSQWSTVALLLAVSYSASLLLHAMSADGRVALRTCFTSLAGIRARAKNLI